jgi:hypothetical protein
MRGENAKPYPSVIACDEREAFAQGSTYNEAIHSFFVGTMDCFAAARNDGELAV